MKTRIGFVVAQNTVEYVQRELQQPSPDYELQFLLYTDPEELPQLYLRSLPQVDALLFSGGFPLRVIQGALGEPRVPYATLGRDVGAVFALLLQVAEERHSDLSRVVFSFNEGQAPLAVEICETLEPACRPILSPHSSNTPEEYSRQAKLLIERSRQGEFDSVITFYSNSMPQLIEAGLQVYYLPPDALSIRRTIASLLTRAQEQYLDANRPVVGIVEIPELTQAARAGNSTLSNLLLAQVADALEEFNRENNRCLTLESSGERIEIITTNRSLRQITCDYRTCTLLKFLGEHLASAPSIFWGVGQNLDMALENAHLAANWPRQGPAVSLLKSGSAEPIPLHLPVNETAAPEPEPIELEGVSRANRRKLATLMQNPAQSGFSCEELAFLMSITVRSASRIVGALEQAGLVELVQKRQEKLRGRPAKIYQFTAHGAERKK